MGLQSSGNESIDQVILGHLCHFQQPLREQGLQASQIQVVNEWHDMLDCTVKYLSPSCHHYRATYIEQNIWRENLLEQRTFGAKLHKSNFESKDGTRSMKY